MTKKRALGIRAIVRKKAINSLHETTSETEHNVVFCLESFCGDILKAVNPTIAGLINELAKEGSTYISGDTKTCRFSPTIGTIPYNESVHSFLNEMKTIITSNRTDAPLTIWYNHSTPTEMPQNGDIKAIDEDLCINYKSKQNNAINGVISATVYAQLTSLLYKKNPENYEHFVADHVRYLISQLSDEDYSSLIDYWRTCIQQTLKNDFPELEGEVELVFSNEAVIEE